MAQLGSLYVEVRGARSLQRSLGSAWRFDAPEGFPEEVRNRLGDNTFDGKPLVVAEEEKGPNGVLPGVVRLMPGEGLKALAIWAVENEWAHDRIKIDWSHGWPVFSWRKAAGQPDTSTYFAKLEYAEKLGALPHQQPLGSIEWKRAMAMYELGEESVRTFAPALGAGSPKSAELRQCTPTLQSSPCSASPACPRRPAEQAEGSDRSTPEPSSCFPSEANACRSVASNKPFVAGCDSATIAGGAGDSNPRPKSDGSAA